jgi:predicted site-specific integrase-resolvase
MNNQNKNLLSKKEAAEMLYIHPNTLDRWVSHNIVKAVVIATWSNGKRILRFRKSDIQNIGHLTTPILHTKKRKSKNVTQ